MKKNILYSALFALTTPWSLYAIGLGEMMIKSSLNQPFSAEIELIDVGNTPLPGIKVGIADPEYFQRLGLEPIAAFSLLTFKLEKNANGQFIINIRSFERITEPYMELVVDLTWPQGQLYKAYTVLLDPPGYQLVSALAQSSPAHYAKKYRINSEPGVIDKTVTSTLHYKPQVSYVKDRKKKTTYGPTMSNENVWQIAQRYKTSELILPQVILAIVGANPDAFLTGNLNGLQDNNELVIPATEEIAQVPAALATQEVMAHDNAWNEKKPISHVIAPPYLEDQNSINDVPNTLIAGSNYFVIPPIPQFTTQSIVPKVNAPLVQLVKPESNILTNQPLERLHRFSSNPAQEAVMRAELSITASAVESISQSNSILNEQLHLLQAQNNKLQTQLDKRDQEIALINAKMQVILKQRKAVASQATTSIPEEQSSISRWLLLLLSLAAGGGFIYWYIKNRSQEAKDDPYVTTALIEPKPVVPESWINETNVVDNQDQSDSQSLLSQNSEVPEVFAKEALSNSGEGALEDNSKHLNQDTTLYNEYNPSDSKDNDSHAPDHDLLEFETDLQQSTPKETLSNNPTKEGDNDPDQGLEFVTTDSVEKNTNSLSVSQDDSSKDDNISSISVRPAADEVIFDEIGFDNEKVDFHPIEDDKPGFDSELDPAITDFFAVNNLEENNKSHELSPTLSKEQHNLLNVENTNSNVTDNDNPLKSKTALDTLLSLAKTYIGMDDPDSAVSSLEEVMSYGSEAQKAKAKALLDEIKSGKNQ